LGVGQTGSSCYLKWAGGGGEVSQVVFVTDFFFGGGAVGMWGQMKALNGNRVVRTGKGEFLGFV